MFRLAVSLSCGFLVSCAMPLSETEVAGVHTIGIVNSFPEHPNMAKIGTTVFNNRVSTVPDRSFKRFLSDEVEAYLRSRGYGVRLVHDRSALESGEVQLLLILQPSNAYQQPETFGFGFYKRSMLGLSPRGPESYVAMTIRPIPRESSSPVFPFRGAYRENFSRLRIDDLPRTWESATDFERRIMSSSLRENIRETASKLLDKIGLPRRR